MTSRPENVGSSPMGDAEETTIGLIHVNSVNRDVVCQLRKSAACHQTLVCAEGISLAGTSITKI
jgi:hypothetical protein